MSRRVKAEIVKQIVQMYRDGGKLEYIAATFNVSMAAICRFAKLAGLSRGKGRQRKAA